VEVVGVGELITEGGAASASVTFSLCTSYSSLESLRMMMLASPGGSSSREVSEKVSSSLEKRSTTGVPSDGPPCSYTGDGGLRDETTDGDVGGSGDPDGEGGGVEALLGEDEEPVVDEWKCLVPLLASIVNK
jgi:hypothetical protein